MKLLQMNQSPLIGGFGPFTYAVKPSQ